MTRASAHLPKLVVGSVLPMVFFAALLLLRAPQPAALVFDEAHYVPATKALITLKDNLNWEHPPLAKLIMGAGWWLFSDQLHLLGEPTVFRVIAIAFGLWTLWGVRAWMVAAAFQPAAVAVAVWLTGFNMLWFVQSKTAMLDVFFTGFGLWGALYVWRSKSRGGFFLGWVLLGLAVACKWSAAPYALIALVLAQRPILDRLAGAAVSLAAYAAAFSPLALLERAPVPLGDLVDYHRRMIDGMGTIATAEHPYRSVWWQWVLLTRPMWYHFEQTPAGDRCVWAAGNPVLWVVALPCVLLVLWAAVRGRDRAARAFAALYWLPLLFWIVVPRKMQLFYYYLGPSLLLGPIVVWAHERFYYGRIAPKLAKYELQLTRGWLLTGLVLLCALTFLYFLPIMDGRLLPPNSFSRFMWFQSWI